MYHRHAFSSSVSSSISPLPFSFLLFLFFSFFFLPLLFFFFLPFSFPSYLSVTISSFFLVISWEWCSPLLRFIHPWFYIFIKRTPKRMNMGKTKFICLVQQIISDCAPYHLTRSDIPVSCYRHPIQWRSKDVRGPWTTDSPGPLPILHNLIPLTPPSHTPLLRLCTRLPLLCDFKYGTF